MDDLAVVNRLIEQGDLTLLSDFVKLFEEPTTEVGPPRLYDYVEVSTPMRTMVARR